jgi:hypothetical protein
MSRAGILGAACMAGLAFASAAFAQSSRLSVVGGVDYARITEDDGYLGAGLGAAGGLQLHLTEATGLEIEVGRRRHVRDLGFHAVAFDPQGRVEAFPFTARWEGTATFVMATVSHAFGMRRVRPVVSGGGGFMSHGGTTRGPLTLPQIPPGHTAQPGDLDERKGTSSSGFAVDGGAGVDVRVSRRVTVRPLVALRLVGTGNVGPKYIIRTGARIAFGL